MSMQDSSVLVIGGTHGMGHTTARMAAARGARVMVTGSNALRVRTAQAAFGADIPVLCSDMSRIDHLDALAHAARAHLGEIDAVLIFAAIAELAPFTDVTEASFDRQFAINARGAFFAMQRLAPLVKDGGSITVTTVTPATASASMSVYMGTKAAVLAFARVLAAELLPRRIRVNALAPGFIDTPTLGVANLDATGRASLASAGDAATPMRRHGTVEEVAQAALFLAFEATFCTGIELPVDGGLSTVDRPAA